MDSARDRPLPHRRPEMSYPTYPSKASPLAQKHIPSITLGRFGQFVGGSVWPAAASLSPLLTFPPSLSLRELTPSTSFRPASQSLCIRQPLIRSLPRRERLIPSRQARVLVAQGRREPHFRRSRTSQIQARQSRRRVRPFVVQPLVQSHPVRPARVGEVREGPVRVRSVLRGSHLRHRGSADPCDRRRERQSQEGRVHPGRSGEEAWRNAQVLHRDHRQRHVRCASGWCGD